MSLFHNILSQLQEKISRETNLTEAIAAIISATVGATVTKEQITVRDNTVSIKTSPTLKMAISLNKEKILNALKEANVKITTIQ